MKDKKMILILKGAIVLLASLFIILIFMILYKANENIQNKYTKYTSENLGNMEKIQDKISIQKKETCIVKVSLNELDIVTHLKGRDVISIKKNEFVKQKLPDEFYNNIDFSSFQPFMDYKKVIDKRSPAYRITRSKRAYNDQYGFRRYRTNKNQFTVNGEDDYVVALGTFYKEKGTCGSRYLVITTTGMFTIITGDEKADDDTDEMNMFSTHGDGDLASIIEWIVDQDHLQSDIKFHGTVTAGPVKAIQGKIKYLYKIESHP